MATASVFAVFGLIALGMTMFPRLLHEHDHLGGERLERQKQLGLVPADTKLPPRAEVEISGRISELWDKGKAAVIGFEGTARDSDGDLFTAVKAATLRLTGQGEDAPGKGASGDLYVKVRVQTHKYFERRNKTIHNTVGINVAQAALGEVRETTVAGGHGEPVQMFLVFPPE